MSCVKSRWSGPQPKGPSTYRTHAMTRRSYLDKQQNPSVRLALISDCGVYFGLNTMSRVSRPLPQHGHSFTLVSWRDSAQNSWVTIVSACANEFPLTAREISGIDFMTALRAILSPIPERESVSGSTGWFPIACGRKVRGVLLIRKPILPLIVLSPQNSIQSDNGHRSRRSD